MYENRFGRFTAVDPLLASGKSVNPQTFNRFVYVLNNPLVFRDVDGQIPVYFSHMPDGKIHWTTDQTYAKREGYQRYEGKAQTIRGDDGKSYIVRKDGIFGTKKSGNDQLVPRATAGKPMPPPSAMPINEALLKDLGDKAPGMQKMIVILALSGAAGGAGAAGAVGTGTFYLVIGTEVFVAVQQIGDIAEYDKEVGLIMATTRSEAFREAKRNAGIQVSQQPTQVDYVPLVDNGQTVLGPDGKPIMTREYIFETKNGRIVIQEHSAGHNMGQGGAGDQGPHFNVRPEENTRTGKVPGTKPHYPFERSKPVPRIRR